MSDETGMSAERVRLLEEEQRQANWKRWGTYLPERQWGTVREDYSEHGTCWEYFPHDHARSRAYRWGEDGLLGWCDRQCRLCFHLSLWNGKDVILKERLFGLTNSEGNHGEDVKELYFYTDATPTYSYAQAMYRYPIDAYPYKKLVEENAKRGKDQPEYELVDTGILDDNRFVDVTVTYAKASPDDTLIEIELVNRSSEPTELHVLPTMLFRNTWSWGNRHPHALIKPRMWREDSRRIVAQHHTLGLFYFDVGMDQQGQVPELLFTENETDYARIFGFPSSSKYVKDAFHRVVIHGEREAVNPANHGTKACAWYQMSLEPGKPQRMRMRLCDAEHANRDYGLGESFTQVLVQRKAEADAFYQTVMPAEIHGDKALISRQSLAGLLWTKQFYYYVVSEWLDGDFNQPKPPASRAKGRNHNWRHLYNRDILSIPDTWEYPWYAAWDLAFHMVPMARVDPVFAKEQLVLLLREWYMHPNGQIPAYEFCFDDVNPPVHAWACWRVYQRELAEGRRDRLFLSRTFQKLVINFTWWVNRKDPHGENVFSGGFLGLDNIGVFDRSQPLPTGGRLEQADATAWMAFFCGTMLSMALELSTENPAYEDMASKFFEHFVSIVDAMNTLGGTGLWDERDGFYYDRIRLGDDSIPMRIRSLVGVLPIIACEVLDEDVINKLPGFSKRMNWFLRERSDLAQHISYMEMDGIGAKHRRLLAIPSRERLVRVLSYMLDEDEFLSPYGIRSLSKIHAKEPFILKIEDEEYRVEYAPGESPTTMFGGNSNWRGPVWFPINYMIVKALERYDRFYGNKLLVECPTGSGNLMTLGDVSQELRKRLIKLFEKDEHGMRPSLDGQQIEPTHDGHELLLFHEFFHGDTGRGLGASHQTGWTALVASLLAGLKSPQTSGV